MPPKNSTEKRLLTELELEIMNIIWDRGECTVREVQEALPRSRDLAYTTVATMMKILEKKKILKSSKSDRSHTYQALLRRIEYEARSLSHLTQKVFQGSSSSLVMRLLDESELSFEELEAIRKNIEERLNK